MNVRFCPSCRSLVLSEFRFCPYCGVAIALGPSLDEALEEPFARIAERTEAASSHAVAEARFAELEERLARLEADMELLAGELEGKGGEKS